MWAFLGWIRGVLIYLRQDKFVVIFGFHDGIVETFYAVWSKTATVFVRPLSLRLRLLINLGVGHSLMGLLLLWGECYRSLVAHGLLFVMVIYEVCVFSLQRFIFGRLLGVYLEEVCCFSIISMIVLSAIGFE